MIKKDKIKILFIMDLLTGFGGTEKHLFQLVKNIDSNKFECYLFAFQSNPNFLKNYETYCHILPFSLKKIYNWEAFRTAPDVIRFIKKEQIDIVQSFQFGADVFGTLVSRLAKVPLIISSWRDLGHCRTGRYRIADRVTQPLIHRFLSVCDTVTEAMVATGIPEDKITRIYNGIDLSEWPESTGISNGKIRKKLKVDTNSFVIGNNSHFRPEKGHNIFFEAVKRLVHQIPNLKVFALGGPGKAKHFQNVIQQNKLLTEIVTIDYVQDLQDIKEYISVYDVACLTPISNEGFSNAILEEMAMGKPVIATDVGGNAEAVVDSVTGYIIPPNNVDALENAILKLYRNPELRMRMGAKGRKRVETHFRLKRMIQNIENYYLEALNTHCSNARVVIH